MLERILMVLKKLCAKSDNGLKRAVLPISFSRLVFIWE